MRLLFPVRLLTVLFLTVLGASLGTSLAAREPAGTIAAFPAQQPEHNDDSEDKDDGDGDLAAVAQLTAAPASGCVVCIDASGVFITLREALPDKYQAGDLLTIMTTAGRKLRLREVRDPGDLTVLNASLLNRAWSQSPRLPIDQLVLLRTNRPVTDGSLTAWQLAPAPQIGDTVQVWSNTSNVITTTGQAALSVGTVSGAYALPHDLPPVTGRGGKVLSAYTGAVYETTAAVNLGSHGGPVCTPDGRLIGLATMATAPERRLGLVVPLAVQPSVQPPEAAMSTTMRAATAISQHQYLLALLRPSGLGNPPRLPRPQDVTDDTPDYLRERLQNAWRAYLHQQQVLWIDQPALALAVSEDVLVTAVEHLHGDAQQGWLLLPDGSRGPAVELLLATDRLAFFAVLKRYYHQLNYQISNPRQSARRLQVIAKHQGGGSFTRTTGIVSARDRNLGGSTVFQTDARINYGSLGAAVLDSNGQLLGITVAIGPHTDWLLNAGIGFVAPVGLIMGELP